MWTEQIKKRAKEIGYSTVSEPMRSTHEKKNDVRARARGERCLSLPFVRSFVCQINVEVEASQSKKESNMYNTSGSDIDIDEFEYHSGSRKVRPVHCPIVCGTSRTISLLSGRQDTRGKETTRSHQSKLGRVERLARCALRCKFT